MKRTLAALLSAAALLGCSVIATTATAAEDTRTDQASAHALELDTQAAGIFDIDLFLGFMGIFDID